MRIRTGTGEEHGEDPHIWHNPLNAKIMCGNIAGELEKADPAHAAAYRANLKAYDAQLDKLDAWVKRQLATIPADQRKLVTNHDAFGYYVDHYHLRFVGSIIPSFDTSAELSGKQLDQIVAKIKAQHVRAIFSESSLPPKTAEAIGTRAADQRGPRRTRPLQRAYLQMRVEIEALGELAITLADRVRYQISAAVQCEGANVRVPSRVDVQRLRSVLTASLVLPGDRDGLGIESDSALLVGLGRLLPCPCVDLCAMLLATVSTPFSRSSRSLIPAWPDCRGGTRRRTPAAVPPRRGSATSPVGDVRGALSASSGCPSSEIHGACRYLSSS